MNCMEARRMVTPYVNRTLSDKEMEAFLDHIEHCSDCMEELDIYFTLYKAMDSLDSGTHHEYDFVKMLKDDIHMARRAILMHRLSRLTRIVIVLLAEFFLFSSILIGYGMKQGQPVQDMFQKAILRLNPRYQGMHPEGQGKLFSGEGIPLPDVDEILKHQLKKLTVPEISRTQGPKIQQNAADPETVQLQEETMRQETDK